MQIGGALNVQSRNLRSGVKDAVVELLSIGFEAGEAPGGAIKLKTQESNALENLAANIEAETKAIDSLKSAIAEARKKLAALDG